MKTIVIKAGEPMPNCEKLTGYFAGVRLPRSVPVFDVRDYHAEDTIVKCLAPSGKYALSLYSSERAWFLLGDVTGYTTPMSCSTYLDARTCSETELARQVKGIRHQVAIMWREYRKALHRLAKPGDGGSCVHRPALAYIANYGWGISAKRDGYLVAQFLS